VASADNRRAASREPLPAHQPRLAGNGATVDTYVIELPSYGH
jgi:hypothetical protein